MIIVHAKQELRNYSGGTMIFDEYPVLVSRNLESGTAS